MPNIARTANTPFSRIQPLSLSSSSLTTISKSSSLKLFGSLPATMMRVRARSIALSLISVYTLLGSALITGISLIVGRFFIKLGAYFIRVSLAVFLFECILKVGAIR